MIPFKDAVKKLHKDRELKLFFCFCEKDEKNKPAVLVDTKKIDPKTNEDAKALLAKAKAKGTAVGMLQINKEGALCVKPQGAGLSGNKLKTGFTIAVNSAQVADLVVGVEIGEPDAEDAPAKTGDAALADKVRGMIAALQTKLAGEAAAKAQEALSAQIETLEAQLAKLTGETPAAAAKTTRPPPVDEKLDPKQLKTKAKGTEYKDEDKGLSFRTADPARKGVDVMVTDYKADPKESEARIEDGRLVDAQGRRVDEKQGFVVNPETGKLHTFDAKTIYIENKVTKERRPHFGGTDPSLLGPDERFVMPHHTTPLAGGDVAGAGEVVAEDGKIRKIKDQSGHYKPTADLTHQTVQSLKDQGAQLIDDEIVAMDEDGDEISATRAQEANYAMVQHLDRQVSLVEKQRQKRRDEQQPPDPQLEKLAAELEKKIKAVEPIRLALRKAGVGPSNKEAKVELGGKGITEEEFQEVKGDRVKINELLQKKYGIEEALEDDVDGNTLNNMLLLNVKIFTGMKTVKMGAETFLQTGGGEKAIRQKESATEGLDKLLTEKEFAKIQGDRKLINKAIKKRTGKADVLPETVSNDLLHNRTAINLLIAKGIKAPAAPLSTKLVDDPDNAGQQVTLGDLAKRRGQTIDEVRAEVKRLARQAAAALPQSPDDSELPSDWLNMSLTASQELADAVGQTLEQLKAWIAEAGDELYPDQLGAKVGMTDMAIRDKISAARAARRGAQANVPDVDDDDDDDDDDLVDPNASDVGEFDGMWGNTTLSLNKQQIADRLGISLAEVESLDLDGDGIYPMDLAKKLSVTIEEIHARLSAKPEVDEVADQVGELNDMWGNTNLRPSKPQIAERLGLPLTEVEALDPDGEGVYPTDLAKKLGVSVAEIHARLIAKR